MLVFFWWLKWYLMMIFEEVSLWFVITVDLLFWKVVILNGFYDLIFCEIFFMDLFICLFNVVKLGLVFSVVNFVGLEFIFICFIFSLFFKYDRSAFCEFLRNLVLESIIVIVDKGIFSGFLVCLCIVWMVFIIVCIFEMEFLMWGEEFWLNWGNL